ncbi:myosin heavy chain, partial [Trypanosoma theileri]
TGERDELAENLRATEDAKAEVEKNRDLIYDELMCEREEAIRAREADLELARSRLCDAESKCGFLDGRVSRLERDKARLKSAYTDVLRENKENAVRLRVRHDLFGSGDGCTNCSPSKFSLTEKLLSARVVCGKENGSS